MDGDRAGRRGPVAALVAAGLAVLAVLGAAALMVAPMSTELASVAGSPGSSVGCGSMLHPTSFGEFSHPCDERQGTQSLTVALLLAAAAVLVGAAVVLGARVRSDGWRVVVWAALPAGYLVAVLWAAAATYPYVASREDISGLEYLYQGILSVPLAFLLPGVGSPTGTVVALLLAGLTQAAVFAGICVVGHRSSRRRAARHRARAGSIAPVL